MLAVCAFGVMILASMVLPLQFDSGEHINATWCWLITDTDLSPGRACTAAERGWLLENDTGTLVLDTKGGDPIHFNVTLNESFGGVMERLDDADICVEFAAYSIDLPTCLFRYLEKNETGGMWWDLPADAFGSCPPPTGSLLCHDIGPEPGGGNISTVDEARNVSFYIFDVESSGGTKTIEIDTLFLNLSYTSSAAPRARLGSSPEDAENATTNDITFGIRCDDNVAPHTLQLWGNFTGTWKANQTNSSPSNGSWWNVTVYDIPRGIWEWGAYCNDTIGNNDFTDSNRTLNVTTDPTAAYMVVGMDPEDIMNVGQNSTFQVNVTVVCRGGGCGNIAGRLRYNDTESFPDTDIPTSSAQPFHIIQGGSPNPMNCPTNPLAEDESCNLTWEVNATGTQGQLRKIGAMVYSDNPGIADNYTANATIRTVSCIIDVAMRWSNLSFGVLVPGQGITGADLNGLDAYNVTVQDTTTCPVDLYIMSTDMQHNETGYIINAENISVSNTSNEYSASFPLSAEWKLLSPSMQPETNRTLYFWLDVPEGIVSGPYNGSLTVQGVEEGNSP